LVGAPGRPLNFTVRRHVNLIASTERCFPLEPVPTEPIVEEAYLRAEAQGDGGATRCFSGRRWNALAPDELRYHSDAMYMFTPRAHQYYLPAFMTACLLHPSEVDEIPDKILWHLAAYDEPFWLSRVRLLTPEQCGVVTEFLKAIADAEHRESGHLDRALNGLERAKRGV
jgi:hypothetical protein